MDFLAQCAIFIILIMTGGWLIIETGTFLKRRWRRLSSWLHSSPSAGWSTPDYTTYLKKVKDRQSEVLSARERQKEEV